MIKEEMQKAILNYEFEEAKKIFFRLNVQEQDEILSLIAYDNDIILIYTFLCYLISEKNTSYMHHLTSVIMSTALCHIQGAYQSAYYHARKALELSPENVDIKEYLLFFYEIPERLLSREDAIVIAKEVLIKKKSKAARKLINEI